MRHFDRMTAPHWLTLYALLLAAWAGVWAMTAPPLAWGTLWRDICLSAPVAMGFPGLFGMWLLMAAAMMLPTALPALATYDHLADAQGVSGGGRLVAGYAIVWIGFAAAAAGAQTAIGGQAESTWIAALLLALAGAYQFSTFKDACLSRCRRPLVFFLEHWARGPLGMGLRLGAVCLGCCWALMALGLIGGAMSLGFMALATVLMTVEKLSRGVVIPRAIGLACLSGAGFLIGGYL
ncbi:DUF2182 domain-containing protein [Jannaschia sp. S6380]|uniref:DUF2182 domain-containing protein n=1 Tax=Jannaschia sp. S6380 TaxID=2926408 RepID=UPI001FF31FE6|nr:DUF2182 domain-containing protein [Jannaschia sp. S6380]MCK0166811.1 DUF2182 domain-containing protein [Jannaschia sp. S6380]